jgi:hypothetical protein
MQFKGRSTKARVMQQLQVLTMINNVGRTREGGIPKYEKVPVSSLKRWNLITLRYED